MNSEIIVIPKNEGRSVRSLCWERDELIDWVSGGIRYRLDKTSSDPRVNYAYRFDKAVASSDGTYAVIYEQLGTKGLILKEGCILREINRSFYWASVYEYPVTVFRLLDGRFVLAHCPDDYRKIEIEELETGARLTSRETKPVDFFHSRLEVSPSGRFLLSAGWILHPLNDIQIFDVESAISNPGLLDQSWNRNMPEDLWEIHAATFDGDDRIVFTAETYEEENFIGVYSVLENRVLSYSPLEEIAGTLMSAGTHVIGFFGHPKMIDPWTGKVVKRWADFNTGEQNSCIIHHIDKPPPLALDPKNKRFAVAGLDAITVLQL
jgi:hypothetical protein